ncbi:MAG: patatin-like phospholipase RssA [Spiribacter sp.]|nr:patatin-like phospholipase RssA [Spiribacter sp.]MDR9488922.1 patatin-like phospholipase RssA [Spiribacter sp.]
MPNPSSVARPRIGLALGGGAARGWAHMGVIRALHEAGIKPDIVAGTSVGAIVGAMFCSGHLEAFEGWVRDLTRRDVIGYMDFALGNGGFIQGRRLMERFHEAFGVQRFDALALPLGVVATDLYSGQERWLQKGDLATAVRASMALPGLFTPVQVNAEWLVDGGLVNPVPVSLCHAMGADRVIAVNLNDGLLGRRIQSPIEKSASQASTASAEDSEGGWLHWLSAGFKDRAEALQAQFRRGSEQTSPGVFDVIATAVNVMQDRITRSRMAGDPPDLLISPQLAEIGLLEMHRGAEIIEEGYASVQRMDAAIAAFRAH